MAKPFALAVFVLLAVCCVWHALHIYVALPELIREDSYAAGKSDRMVPRSALLKVYLVSVGGTILFVAGLALYIPRQPDARIKIPNREYWLAPERRPATLDFMVVHLIWFGSATLLFMALIFNGCFRAARGEPGPEIPLDAWLAGGFYLMFILVQCVHPLIRFRRRVKERRPSSSMAR